MSMSVKTENLIKLEPSWLEHLEEEFSKDIYAEFTELFIGRKILI